MKKLILLLIFTMLTMTASAQVNLDFAINIEDKIYFPNEKIKVDVSVINRDVSFAAKNVVLTLTIADREYNFKLGDISAGQTFSKEITLPEFPPGTHTIKGVLNYTGIFDETFTVETYNSFEVRFPVIEHYPRNVNVIGFNLPDKMIAGKTYNVSIVVKNEGTVGGNMIIEVASLEEFVDEETFLGPGESKTINLKINFKNTEVSLIEARVYALINGIRYLLVYSGKRTYVVPERKAKLQFDRVEFVDEPDNEINPNDEVKIKVHLSNIGNYPATSVVGTLTSISDVIEVIKDKTNYEVILVGESVGSNDSFIIKSKETKDAEITLNLNVDYVDSEPSTVTFEVPIKTTQSSEACTSNDQCKENEVCENSQCIVIVCKDGYIKDHQCIKYECTKDSDCKNFYTCDLKLHICNPPQCTNDFQCRDNEVCYQGKCREAFNLVFVPINWNPNEFTDFKSKAYIALSDFLSKTPFNQCSDKEGRVRAHYINPNSCQVGACEDHCTDCISKARECIIRNGLEGSYNKFVAITKGSWKGGCASDIPGDGSSTDYKHPNVIIHEFGHSVGLCHIPLCGARCGSNEPEGCSWCPNYEDILKPQNNYIMSYCSNTNQFGPSGYNYLRYNFDGVSPTAGGLSRWLEGC